MISMKVITTPSMTLSTVRYGRMRMMKVRSHPPRPHLALGDGERAQDLHNVALQIGVVQPCDDSVIGRPRSLSRR